MTNFTTNEGKELARLSVATVEDVLLARLVIREEAGRLGFAAHALTQIATVVSEIARNVVQHAGQAGNIRVFEISQDGRPGLRIAVEDAGPGIADVDRALTGATPGAGIPGCRKLMDEFAIQSNAEGGTSVTMIKWLPNA